MNQLETHKTAYHSAPNKCSRINVYLWGTIPHLRNDTLSSFCHINKPEGALRFSDCTEMCVIVEGSDDALPLDR